MDSRFAKPRRIHLVGIGGVGMSGIAEVLLTLGHRVTGSDIAEGEATRRLASLGATITYGHREEAVSEDTDVVVISSAVKYSNPEVVRARTLKIPVIPRAEMLAELMRLKFGVAVAGSHGKTTTTSLIGAVVARAGLDPTIVIGGRVHAMGSNARVGRGELMVTEADESDGTFLLLSPSLAVVTNIDPELLDYYGNLEAARGAFLEFMNRVPFFGAVVAGLDNVNVRALLPKLRKRVITYGVTADADYVASDLAVEGMRTRFRVSHGGADLGLFHVALPGRHQAVNGLATLAVAVELGIDLETVRAALAEFAGIHRRFEVCGEAGGITVISDYGHHPAEIRATLLAAREGFARRLVTMFQPHRYTRTRDLFDEFLDAFDSTDHLILTDIYGAGEDPIEGVTGEALYLALKRRGHLRVTYVPRREDLVAAVRPLLEPGDMVIALGAGSIHGVAEGLASALRGEGAE